ncbi:MAG: biotin transporter BioY [Candidatus Latescibacteria bacterium]|nr:biotin transporter BioY [Candidatus Latescibacterota bacterium]
MVASVGLMAGLTAVGAFIRIPLPYVPVPFTLQVLFVFLAGALLGARLGALSQLVYLGLGLAGLPVFAGGAAGPGSILMPTFGYIIGFVFAAYVIGTLTQKTPVPQFRSTFLKILAGLPLIYLFGVVYLYLNLNLITGKSCSLQDALLMGCLIFLPFDVVKAAIAAFIAVKVRNRLPIATHLSTRA